MERALARAQPIAQRRRALSHDGVLEEARPKLLLGLALVLGQGLERRQQASRLQEDETRGEREERGHLIRGEPGHRAHPREVRVGQVPQSYGEDLELPFLDELEQQVERSVESLDRHARGLRLHHGRASRSARARRRSSSSTGMS